MSRSPGHTNIAFFFLILFAGEVSWSVVQGFGLDLGACRDEKFNCDCGSGSGRTVPVYQKQCNFVSNWQVWCRACENGVEVFKDDVCRNYRLCGVCEENLKACKSCPHGFHGRWCDQKCDCLNGGTCVGPGSLCYCLPEYKGRFCEFRIGCEVPVTSGSMSVTKFPQLNPTVLQFRCPEKGFKLKGNPRLTCDMATRTWSDVPPVCVPVCLVPETLRANLTADLPEGGLVMSGESLRFRCRKGLILLGDPETKCLNGSKWSQPLPSCVQLVFCKKPRLEPYAITYQTISPPSYPPFSNGTQISFQCAEGHLLLGEPSLACGQNGKWSAETPSCIKVHTTEVDCNTRGYELLGDVGHRIRIRCPGGCSSGRTEVWGSRIYEESSSVCRAALHSGKISNVLGGSVLVARAGTFAYFQGIETNGVQSMRKQAESGSFVFPDNKHLELGGDFTGCPKGWWNNGQSHCFIAIGDLYNWTEAKWICHNLEANLPTANEPAVLSYIVERALFENSLDSFWLLDQNNNNSNNNNTEETISNYPQYGEEKEEDEEEEEDGETHSFSNETTSERKGSRAAAAATSVPSCLTVEVLQDNSSPPRAISCEDRSHFVCVINLADRPKTCHDPGHLENGLVELEKTTERLYVGSVLRYKCSPLYILEGDETATCTQSGRWSSAKPRCVRVPTCTDPPVPPFSRFEIAGSSALTPGSGRPALGRRSNRFGIVSRPRQRRSVQSDNNLPPGHYPVGTRVFYSCHSRYYELIGSQTRRCQADGSWSGRDVTCLPLCGRSDSSRSPFIVNGNASEVGQWPWQVGLGFRFPGAGAHQLLCGGSLVAELWVLTAAHCVTEENSLLLVDMDSLEVYAGKYYQDMSRDDEFVQKRKVVEIHVHPDYDPSVFDSDIALIKLDSPLELTTRVQPVCLPNDKTTKMNLVEGRRGVVTGWGLTEEAMNSEFLRQAVIRVVSDETCERGYQEAGMPLTVSENMFCGGDNIGRADACSGDSGGPLVFQVDKGDRRHWVQEGVVSWGSLKGCGLPNQYSGFTAVHRFLDWVHLYL